MKSYTDDQIASLIAHLDDDRALCRHDIGGELSDVLRFLVRKVHYLDSLVPSRNHEQLSAP